MSNRHPIIQGETMRTEYITGAPRTVRKRILPILTGSLGYGRAPYVSPNADVVQRELRLLSGKVTVLITPRMYRPYQGGGTRVGWEISIIPDRKNLQGATFTPVHKTRTLEYGYVNDTKVRSVLVGHGTVVSGDSELCDSEIGWNSKISNSTVRDTFVNNDSEISASTVRHVQANAYGSFTSINTTVDNCKLYGGATLISDKPAGKYGFHNLDVRDIELTGGHLKIHNPTENRLLVNPEINYRWLQNTEYDARVFKGGSGFYLSKDSDKAVKTVTKNLLTWRVPAWESSTLCLDDKEHGKHLSRCRCLMWYPLYIDGDPLALEYIRRAQGVRGNIQNPLSAVPLVMLEEQMAVIAANIPAEG